MQLPAIPGLTCGVTGLAGLAAFVRDRLGEVARLWPRRADGALTRISGRDAQLPDRTPDATRQLALAVVGAAGPFASTSYARARLLRQMHASGLLDDRETEQLLGVAQ